MPKISFDTGLKEYELNDSGEFVTFNPTDIHFATKVVDAFDRIDSIMDKYREKLPETPEKSSELYELTRNLEEDIRAEINDLFEKDVCTPLLGRVNIYALADGLPIWANFLFAIMDELDDSFITEKKKTNPRIQKYTAKYNRSAQRK